MTEILNKIEEMLYKYHEQCESDPNDDFSAGAVEALEELYNWII